MSAEDTASKNGEKLQLSHLIKQVVFRTFPEMRHRDHLLQFAKVINIPKPPTGGEVYDWEEPFYGIDIQMLDAYWQPYGPIYTGVPCYSGSSDNGRGWYGFPQVGTIVGVDKAYGDPERMVVTGSFMFKKNLPKCLEKEMLMQQTPATFLRANENETWIHKALNHYWGEFTDWIVKVRRYVWLGSASVDLVNEVQRLSKEVETLSNILKSHTHQSPPPDQQAGIAGVESRSRIIKEKVKTISKPNY